MFESCLSEKFLINGIRDISDLWRKLSTMDQTILTVQLSDFDDYRLSWEWDGCGVGRTRGNKCKINIML